MSVLCGNRKVHGRDRVHHSDRDAVWACFQGRLTEDCEHGLSAALCAGPGHYPADDPNSPYEHMSIAELTAATSADYHRRGEDCPWDCARCPGNVAADEAERAAEMEVSRQRIDHPVWDGTYTLVDPPSGLSHRTFRVRTQDADDEFAPGAQVIAYLSGPDNESDYTNFGFVDRNSLGYFVKIWRRFADNQALQGDAEAFLAHRDDDGVLTEARCFRCHRKLSVPASINQGYGNDCIKLIGAA